MCKKKLIRFRVTRNVAKVSDVRVFRSYGNPQGRESRGLYAEE